MKLSDIFHRCLSKYSNIRDQSRVKCSKCYRYPITHGLKQKHWVCPPARRAPSRPQCISPTRALTYPNSAPLRRCSAAAAYLEGLCVTSCSQTTVVGTRLRPTQTHSSLIYVPYGVQADSIRRRKRRQDSP